MKLKKIFLVLFFISALSLIFLTKKSDIVSAVELSSPSNFAFSDKDNILKWGTSHNASGYRWRLKDSSSWQTVYTNSADISYALKEAAAVANLKNLDTAVAEIEVYAFGENNEISSTTIYKREFTSYVVVEKNSDITEYVDLDDNNAFVLNRASSIDDFAPINHIINFSMPLEVNQFALDDYRMVNIDFRIMGDSTSTKYYYRVFFTNKNIIFFMKNASDEGLTEQKLKTTFFYYENNMHVKNVYVKMAALDLLNIKGEKFSERAFFEAYYYTSLGKKVLMAHYQFDNDKFAENGEKSNKLYSSANTRPPRNIYTSLVDQLSAPKNTYYDETTKKLHWNSVEGAVKYLWSVNSIDWFESDTNYADVSQNIDFLRNSAIYNADFKVIATAKSNSVKDSYPSLCKVDISAEAENDIIETDLIHNNQQISDLIDYPSKSYKLDSNSLEFSDLKINQLNKLSFSYDAISNSGTQIEFLNKENVANEKKVLFKLLESNGTIELGYGANKKVKKLSKPLKTNQKYTLSFGLFNISDKGINKLRLQVKIDYLNSFAEPVNIVFFYHNYLEESLDYKTDGKLYLLNSEKNLNLLKTNFNRDYSVKLKLDDTVLSEQLYSFEKHYDLKSFRPEVSDDYEFASWFYYLDGQKVNIAESGLWTHDFKDLVNEKYYGEIFAEYIQTTFNVNYFLDDKSSNAPSNPVNYKIGVDRYLVEPIKVLDGYIFKGWYTEPEYLNKVENLNGLSGDLNLYAKYDSGWTIKINSTDIKIYHVKDNEMFSLPQITNPLLGYKFDKWQILEDGYFVDYTFENTFVVNKSLEFKAVIVPIKYTITYYLDNGVNSDLNKDYFDVLNHIDFYAPIKEGFYFEGWYLDSNHLVKVSSTQNQLGDLNLYAKYIRDSLPKFLTLKQSSNYFTFPVPALPQGSTYSIKLYLKNDNINPLSVKNSQYIFKSKGEYQLIYNLNVNSETIVKEVDVYIVDNPQIILEGEYNIIYSEGNELEILQAKLSEGLGEIEIKVKKNGNIIELDSNKLTLKEGVYEIIYSDNLKLANDISFFINVEKPVLSSQLVKKIAIGVVGIAFLAGIAILINRKKGFFK